MLCFYLFHVLGSMFCSVCAFYVRIHVFGQVDHTKITAYCFLSVHNCLLCF